MSGQPHVVLVDTYAPTRLLAPRFRELGYRCVRVQSTPEPPPVYANEPVDLDDYVASIVHDGDVAKTLEAVAAFDPVAVVPGGEVGVEFGDLLSERLGTPTNGTALSAARRDKFLMVETIKKAGLRGARQLLVTDPAELADWHRDLGGRIVIKPLRSAGGDGVSFCDTPEESVRAYRSLVGSRDVFAGRNESVVAQEYLSGTEYMVNTVSRDGRHHLCDVWKTTRINANGITDLCDALCLIASDEKVVPSLTEYAGKVLDALGVRHGPAHVEVRMTPDGPCLVEVGARMAGGDIPYYASLGIGESQIEWTADAYVRPDRFHARCGDPYQVRRFCAMVAMVSPYEGTLRGYRDAEAIRRLETFHDMDLLVKPRGRLRRTVDDLTYPVVVTLMSPSEEAVMRDINTIRYLDGLGFYDVEPVEVARTSGCAR
ncbi:ATP-grasp domain-containing protein [Actinoallomurus rhizosphaericola]|uniref:ATP-grasp domain-containing protein n=1 Tax=Actinoallomurus rhizosphaericola TaxID=2952536 RepID=UPI0020927450|nr:ATP-grasp domain-containing protein [Actinoallomurus rhizosphaericola]MCO5995361.1 ATP-grasp domain-containing protein [Actinoallomurus rhizosphaericola]